MALDLPHNETNPYLRCPASDLDLKEREGDGDLSHPDIDIELWRDDSNGDRRGRNNEDGEAVGSGFCDFGGRIAFPGQEMRVSACVSCKCSGEAEKSGKTCQSIRIGSRERCAYLLEDVGSAAVLVDENCEPPCIALARRLRRK